MLKEQDLINYIESKKDEIELEFTEFKNHTNHYSNLTGQYGKNTLTDRQELDQFYTPSHLTIKMLETFKDIDIDNDIFLDPCCGSGNLLAAALILGIPVENIRGNEYDGDMVKYCRKHLKIVCKYYCSDRYANYTEEQLDRILRRNIHQGNALQKQCLTYFTDTYTSKYDVSKINDLSYAQDTIEVLRENNDGFKTHERPKKVKKEATDFESIF